MKRVLILILTISLSLGLVFALGSCGKKDREAFASLVETLEKKLEEKIQDNADAISALRAEYADKIAALEADNSALAESIASTTAAYEAAVAELRADDAALEAKIEALQSEYDEAIASLNAEIDADNAEIEALETELQEILSALEAEGGANEALIAALEEKHDKDVAEIEKNISANAAQISLLDKKYADEASALQGKIDANAQAVEVLTQNHNNDVSALEAKIADNTALINNTKAELEAKIELLNTSFDTELAKITAAIDALSARDAEYGSKIDALLERVAALEARESCVVTFKHGDHRADHVIAVYKGDHIPDPGDPSREGYNFRGWFVEDERWSFIGYTVNGDITLSAKWSDGEVNYVDYVMYKGKNSVENPRYYNDGESFVLKPATRGGYEFLGWFTDEALKYEITEITSDMSSDITLYAGWRALGEYAVVDGGISYTGYIGNEKVVEIPSEVDGLPVVQIGGGAFHQRNDVEKVIIPSSVKTVKRQAFFGNTTITEIVIPEGVEVIEDGAIECYKLKRLHIPSTVTYVGHSDSMTLESITVAEGNETYYSENNCLINRNTKQLVQGCGYSVIPTDGSVTSIGRFAFDNCRNLYSIIIPEAITEICEYAFSGCHTLVEIYDYSALDIKLGDTLENGEIARRARYIHTSEVDSKIKTDDESGFVFLDEGYAVSLIGYRGTEKNVVLPESYNGRAYSIADCAFVCTAVESVDISSGVTAIGDYVFGMSSLKYLDIPESVGAVGSSMFNLCSTLEWVVLPSCAKAQGFGFYTPSALSAVYLRGETEITIDEFNCGEVEVLAYSHDRPKDNPEKHWRYINGKPAVWSEISDSRGLVFEKSSDGTYAILNGRGDCSDTDLIIPEEYDGLPVTHIADGFGTYAVRDIVFPSCLTNIGYGAFRGSAIEELILPEGVVTIDGTAFADCEKLKSVSFPSTLSIIKSGAFMACISLTEVIMPENLAEIEYWAFYNCHNLQAVVLNKNIEYLGNPVFGNTEAKIYYLGSISDWENVTNFSNKTPAFYSEQQPLVDGEFWRYENGEVVMWEPLTESEGLLSESVEYNGEYGYMITGVDYFDGEILVIPEQINGYDVIGIGSGAFANNSTIKYVIFHEKIKFIEEEAFEHCTSLLACVKMDFVENIGNRAFGGCSSLESICIGVEDLSSYDVAVGNVYVGWQAFGDCTSLEKIYIGENVNYIGTYAFFNCRALKYVYIVKLYDVAQGAFSGCYNIEKVYCYYDSYDDAGVDPGDNYDFTSATIEYVEKIVFDKATSLKIN